MDITLVFALFGSVTGALSLVGLVLALGIYKERVDRLERWFNLLAEESLMKAWKSGTVERGSWKSKPEFIGALPLLAQEVCEREAQRLREPSYAEVGGPVSTRLSAFVSSPIHSCIISPGGYII